MVTSLNTLVIFVVVISGWVVMTSVAVVLGSLPGISMIARVVLRSEPVVESEEVVQDISNSSLSWNN